MAAGGSVPTPLAQAREIAPLLGKVTDALNERLTEAEDALAALNLGVTAGVVLRSDEDSTTCLRFGKEGGAWRLTVESWSDYDPETVHSSLLANSSRETRLEAVSKLGDLLSELLAVARSQITDVEAAAEEVSSFVRSVRGETA